MLGPMSSRHGDAQADVQFDDYRIFRPATFIVHARINVSYVCREDYHPRPVGIRGVDQAKRVL